MNIYDTIKNYGLCHNMVGGEMVNNKNLKSESIFDSSNFYFEHFNQIESLFQTTSNKVIEQEFNNILNSFSKNKFNDLFESVAYAYINNRFEFEKRKFSIIVYYLLFKVYPYLIYGSMLSKTINEQIDFINKLEEIDAQKNINISSYTININKYKQYLINYYSNYQTNTVNVNFNNFIGIQFHETGLTYDEIKKCSNNLLIIHAGFNNNYDNVLYKSYRGINRNFLTYDDMRNFKIIEPIKTHKKDLCFELMNNGKIVYDSKYIKPLKQDINDDELSINDRIMDNINIQDDNIKIKNELNKQNNQYYIVLCYDDDDDLKKCRFSISSNAFNFKLINAFINGGIIYPLPSQIYKLYFSKMFYIRKNMLTDIENKEGIENSQTQLLKAKFAKIIKPCFNENYKIAINNICNEFPNEKYLRLYLEGLKNECDKNGKLIFEQYYEFVKLYFFPIIMK